MSFADAFTGGSIGANLDPLVRFFSKVSNAYTWFIEKITTKWTIVFIFSCFFCYYIWIFYKENYASYQPNTT